MKMAGNKSKGTISRCFFVFQLTLWLLAGVSGGFIEGDEGNKSGKTLVSEFFMPIDLPGTTLEGIRSERELDAVEGSGDMTETNDKEAVEGVSRTAKGFDEKTIDVGRTQSNQTKLEEGSGDREDVEGTHEIDDNVPLIGESEILTTTPEGPLVVTLKEVNETHSTTTMEDVADPTDIDAKDEKPSTTEQPEAETVTTTPKESISTGIIDFINSMSTTPTGTTSSESESATPEGLNSHVFDEDETTTQFPATLLPTVSSTDLTTEESVPKFSSPNSEELGNSEEISKVLSEESIQSSTTKAEEPVDEPIDEPIPKLFQKSLGAMPRNIIHAKNMTVGVDPLLIVTNVDPTESEAQMDETVSRKLGAYIVITLILLSFFSLVGYIMMRKRQNRKRRSNFEGNQESLDTEKALLSLSDYKDHSELEENHLKNNEITPIVVKSNSQMNRFEKNTNFGSPKNLNTISTEKNIEKDNVLKSTSENLNQVGGGPLTQVIIEETNEKDAEEDKNTPNAEKLIVKTLIDQDSIPKKPIIINRSSTGYVPVPQDNS